MSVLAKYEFPDRASTEAAAMKCRYESGADILAYGNFIEITTYARNVEVLAKICLANGGKVK